MQSVSLLSDLLTAHPAATRADSQVRLVQEFLHAAALGPGEEWVVVVVEGLGPEGRGRSMKR